MAPLRATRPKTSGIAVIFIALFIRFNLRQPQAVFRGIHAYDMRRFQIAVLIEFLAKMSGSLKKRVNTLSLYCLFTLMSAS
jgi:hypothetical protein